MPEPLLEVCTDSGSGSSGCHVDPRLVRAEGHTTVRVIAGDNAGNKHEASVDVLIDRTDPQITVDTGAYVPATWTRNDVAVHWTCTDIPSGIATCPADQSYGEGRHDVSGTAADLACRTVTRTIPVWVDRTPPTVGFDLDADGIPYAPGSWSRSPVVISPVCADALSGIPDGACPKATTVADGIHAVTARVVDVAGNEGSGSVMDIRVDTIAPTIRGEGSTDQGPYAEASWTNRPVKVVWTCADPGGSGIASCGPDRTVPSGQLTATGRAVDIAGNEAPSEFDVKVDTVPPTVVLSLSAGGAPYAPGTWVNAPVTVTASCSDAESGIPAGACPESRQFGEGIATAQAVVTDVAGNTTRRSAGPIQVDLTAPAITLSATSGGEPYEEGSWAAKPVVVTFTCSDALSGVASCSEPVMISAGDLDVPGAVTDAAGNSARTGIRVRVDRSPPTVTFSGNAGTYSVLDDVAITCASSDSEAGIAVDGCFDTFGPAWTFGAGMTTLSASSVDVAGNVGHGSTTFEVRVTHDDLCMLTRQLSDGPRGQSVSRCAQLAAAKRHAQRGNVHQHDRVIRRYQDQLRHGQRRGWVAGHEANALVDLAQAFIDPPR